MRKWLRSWFAWRFSLTRLVLAVVFLAAFVGLNVCGPQKEMGGDVDIYWGWPLPSAEGVYGPALGSYLTLEQAEQFEQFKWLPWTHQTYRLSYRWRWLHDWVWPVDSRSVIFVIPAIIDALVALIPIALILFLHPRRKPPDECPT